LLLGDIVLHKAEELYVVPRKTAGATPYIFYISNTF